MANKNDFGPLLKETRLSLGLTQQQLVVRAGIRQQSLYSKLERGEYALTPDIAIKICKVLPLQYIPAKPGVLLPIGRKSKKAA
jgi:transcriptional regulator with XRE-family HTH domain